MKHKIIMSAALIISMTGMTGCFFFPAEEELLEPPTVAIEDIAYSTYTAKQKTIEDKTVATGYVFCKSQYNASFPESGGQPDGHSEEHHLRHTHLDLQHRNGNGLRRRTSPRSAHRHRSSAVRVHTYNQPLLLCT